MPDSQLLKPPAHSIQVRMIQVNEATILISLIDEVMLHELMPNVLLIVAVFCWYLTGYVPLRYEQVNQIRSM